MWFKLGEINQLMIMIVCDLGDGGGDVDNEKKSFVTRRPRLQRTCVRDTLHPGDTSFKYYTFNSTIL